MRFETDVKGRTKMNPDQKETLSELKSRLPVDQYNLEVECSKQPSLLEEVGEIAAEVKRASRAAKEHLEYVRADLSTKIRKKPEDYNILGKFTVDVIAATVILQSDYQKAVEDMLDAAEQADAFSTLLLAVEQRKSLIRDAVSLYIHQYYSSQDLSSEERRLGEVTEEQIIRKRAENVRKEERIEEVNEI